MKKLSKAQGAWYLEAPEAPEKGLSGAEEAVLPKESLTEEEAIEFVDMYSEFIELPGGYQRGGQMDSLTFEQAEMTQRCQRCGGPIPECHQRATASGWYSGRKYVWREGRLCLVRVLCTKHALEEYESERE